MAKNILIINASSKTKGSFSREISLTFAEHLQKSEYKGQVLYRDLAQSYIPHVDQNWIDADSKPVANRNAQDIDILKISNVLIQEIRDADIVVLSTPMYNWSIPSSLKAYLDQIMRFDETFTANPNKDGSRYSGLLRGKTLFLLLSRGSLGYGKGERNEYMDFQSSYLKMVFGIMGFEKIHELSINGTKRTTPELGQELSILKRKLASLLDNEVHIK